MVHGRKRERIIKMKPEYIKQKNGYFFVRFPNVSRQYLGFGKGKKNALKDALDSLKKIQGK